MNPRLPINPARNQSLRRALAKTRPAAVPGTRAVITVAAAAIALAAFVLPAQAATRPGPPSGRATEAGAPRGRTSAEPAARMRAACPRARPGQARCLALYRPQATVNRAIAAGASGPAAQPQGWGPQAIESAYQLP